MISKNNIRLSSPQDRNFYTESGSYYFKIPKIHS